jgi:hypothetical protein
MINVECRREGMLRGEKFKSLPFFALPSSERGKERDNLGRSSKGTVQVVLTYYIQLLIQLIFKD